ncbi:hypothetical protein ABIA30_002373 [Mycobacterium sp. MAA66]
MTGLGALLYGGFFGLAALWLFATSDYRPALRVASHGQVPERSNSASVAAASGESSPRSLTHASS